MKYDLNKLSELLNTHKFVRLTLQNSNTKSEKIIDVYGLTGRAKVNYKVIDRKHPSGGALYRTLNGILKKYMIEPYHNQGPVKVLYMEPSMDLRMASHVSEFQSVQKQIKRHMNQFVDHLRQAAGACMDMQFNEAHMAAEVMRDAAENMMHLAQKLSDDMATQAMPLGPKMYDNPDNPGAPELPDFPDLPDSPMGSFASYKKAGYKDWISQVEFESGFELSEDQKDDFKEPYESGLSPQEVALLLISG